MKINLRTPLVPLVTIKKASVSEEKSTDQFYATMAGMFRKVDKQAGPLLPIPYILRSDMYGYGLIPSPAYTEPKRLYGDTGYIERIIAHYLSAPRDVAALFIGEKGMGKTLSARVIAGKMGLPIIEIGSQVVGTGIVDFLAELPPCVVLIDEIEKLSADKDNETSLLQMLDSKKGSPKLFLLSANKEINSDYVKSRPSRIFYKIRFDKLKLEVIEEVAKDFLPKAAISEFMKTAENINRPNYDVIFSLMDEMNRFGITAEEAIKYMNISKMKRFNTTLKIEIYEEKSHRKDAKDTSPNKFIELGIVRVEEGEDTFVHFPMKQITEALGAPILDEVKVVLIDFEEAYYDREEKVHKYRLGKDYIKAEGKDAYMTINFKEIERQKELGTDF